jgi:uncharacterized protein (DUF2236 family)
MDSAIDHESDLVGVDELERWLEVARAASADPLAGLFGPRSVIWQIDREAVIFLGAGRALLLQLAHPWVAAAINEHSGALDDPIGRFHRTFSIVFSMVFGTLDQALAAARRLHRRHAAISGMLPSRVGPFAARSHYQANNVPALRWVHATLIDTALMANALIFPPLSRDERERYYADSRLLAALFGIPQTCLPSDWDAFSGYCETMMQSDTLTVSDAARALAHRILMRAGPWLPVPSWYRALTMHLLPPRLRDAFGFSYGAVERRAAEHAIEWLRRGYFFLPTRLRYVGPYQEAMARLAGRPYPDLATQLINRFWIGQHHLS